MPHVWRQVPVCDGGEGRVVDVRAVHGEQRAERDAVLDVLDAETTVRLIRGRGRGRKGERRMGREKEEMYVVWEC